MPDEALVPAPAPTELAPPDATPADVRRAAAAERRGVATTAGDGPRPSFSRALWRIAAAEVSCGNKVALLYDGRSTFDAMCAQIEGARESIDFEGYIFHDDDVGRRIAGALVAAAERGVHVRMLVDWVGRLPTSRRFFRNLAQERLVVRFFNPPGWRSWLGILPRDHRKLLVTDNACGITGGIGIGNEWTHGVLRRKRSAWRDTAVRIEGAAAESMGEAFTRMWERARGRTPEWRRLRKIGLTRSSHLNTRFDPPSLVGILEGEPGRFRVSRAMQMQALAAQRSFYIASAYFMPSWSELEALGGAARDGVDVRVLVPSRYDHPWLRRFTTRFYERLLRYGVRIWEWRGEMMHAKTNVMDGRWLRVGSTDFNPLGIAINYELDAVIEDRSLGAQAEQKFLEDLERSQEVGLSPRGRMKVIAPGREPTGEREALA